MKLKAIRVENVGVLQAATALEGLTGGLDVIAAANEAGKSTLFRAVTVALAEEFKAGNKATKALRSEDGGAPMIEMDFEAGGEAWRLTKRYLTKATARLMRLAGGQTLDNADAEARLQALLGQTAGFQPLLWVAQEASTAPAQPTATATGVLRAQLAAEIASATGSSLADAVRARVKSRLAGLLTPTGRTRTGGDLDRAKKAADTAAETHRAALVLAAEVASRRERLADLTAREAALADPVAIARRAARLDQARRETADAERANSARAAAEVAFNTAETSLTRARLDCDRVKERLARLDAATSRVTQLTPELAPLSHALAAATAHHAATGLALAAAQRSEHERRRQGIATRLAALDSSTAKARAAAAGARSSAIDVRLVEQARETTRALETLDAELAASVATVALALTSEGRAKVRINGAVPASPAETVLVDQPLVIELVGIGTVTVTPGGGSARSDLLARRERLAVDLMAMLAKCQVASLAQAEARLTAVTAHARAERDAKVELAAALAGETRAGLEADLARLAAALAIEPDGGAVPPTAPGVSLEQAEADHAAATRALEAARVRHQAAARGLDDAMTEARVLSAEVPSPDNRVVEIERLEAAVAAADLSRRSAAVELGVVRERVLSREAAERLAVEMAAAATAVRDAEAQTRRLGAEIAEINGRLMEHERAAGVDARGDVAELGADAERAAGRLARIADETAALQLLEQEFSLAAAADQTEFVAPIMTRLKPHLARVFSGAAVDWTAELGVSGLARGVHAFAFERLSTGTREQVSVLVRLAFAELLADRGHQLPVILDDALVYSDDDRRERMFEALAAAARRHQVIVLTCQRSFAAGLVERHGATAHVMRPWQDKTLLSAA